MEEKVPRSLRQYMAVVILRLQVCLPAEVMHPTYPTGAVVLDGVGVEGLGGKRFEILCKDKGHEACFTSRLYSGCVVKLEVQARSRDVNIQTWIAALSLWSHQASQLSSQTHFVAYKMHTCCIQNVGPDLSYRCNLCMVIGQCLRQVAPLGRVTPQAACCHSDGWVGPKSNPGTVGGANRAINIK